MHDHRNQSISTRGQLPAPGPLESKLSDSGVEHHGDVVELVLGEEAEVLSCWQVLTEQAVDVFVDAPFPWASWVCEVDFQVCLLAERTMLGHFAALVVGERTSHLAVEAVEDSGEAVAVVSARPSSGLTRATKGVVRSTRVPTRD
jgi:hypothetical protein